MNPRSAVRSDQKQLINRFLYGSTGPIVELGVDWGVTTRMLATLFPSRHIIAVDKWDPDYHREIMPDGKRVTAEEKKQAVYALMDEFDNVTIVCADVVEFGRTFDDTVGSIFFDAAHEEEPILEEFKVWLPKLYANGTALVHDANKVGVRRACDRFMFGHFFRCDMCVWDRRSGATLRS